MSLLENIRPFKLAYLTGFVPVLVAGQQIGQTRADFAKVISDFNATWQLTSAGLELSSELKTFEERTKAVDQTFTALSEANILPMMPDYSAFGGIDWFSVCPTNSNEVLFIVKRFYSIFIGIRVNVIILNGYKKDHYWSAIRSKHVDYGAGQMDVIVAGGIRHGESILEALIHEAHDEAGLNAKDLEQAVFTGNMSFKSVTASGFFSNEYFHIFDIDLKDHEPKTNLPHEVEGFKILTNQELIKDVEDGHVFKEQINLIATDFMIRHGILTESHIEYKEIKELLYRIDE